jgi:protein-disulfide isomerase
MRCLGLFMFLWVSACGAQSAPATKSAASASSPKSKAEPTSVKADSVTINLPEGMTRDQADAILSELKAIHQLLLNQNSLPAKESASAPEKIQMKLASGWFSLGRDDAPITLVEFTDYQCPYCRKFHTDTFAELKKSYIDTGKVRFISRDLPLDFHPNAQKAAEAARCAGDQKKYWQLRDSMISNSADLSQDAILKLAQSDSLDMSSFRACLDADRYKAEIQRDAADAGSLGISGTPSFVIGKTSSGTLEGDRVVGAVPLSVFDSEIRKFLLSTP